MPVIPRKLKFNGYDWQLIASCLELGLREELNGIDWTEKELYDPGEVEAEIRTRYGAIIAKVETHEPRLKDVKADS